jgi:hypothetical protein
MAFGTAEQSQQLLRMCGRYGFEPVAVAEPAGWPARLHRLGENILLGMLILARNPRSARWDIFARVRTPAVLTRAELDRRYRGRLPELLDETAV